jgi:hypothetical protein
MSVLGRLQPRGRDGPFHPYVKVPPFSVAREVAAAIRGTVRVLTSIVAVGVLVGRVADGPVPFGI